MKAINRMPEKYKRLVLFFLFLLLAAVLGFFRRLGNVDELWNFTFGNNMAMGLVPYRDFNLLQTPLFAMLHGLALGVFGRELLVTRMLGALLFAIICYLLYLFSEQMEVKGCGRLVLPLVFLLCFDYNVFYEYSCSILAVQLFGMYRDVRFVRQRISTEQYFSVRYQLVTGLFAGAAIMCKQTFGGFVALAAWCSVLLLGFMYRQDRKNVRKAFFARLAGSSIPCFIVLFYLLGTGSWDDFIDMSLKGISTFSSRLMLWEYMAEDPEYMATGIAFLLSVLLGVIYTLYNRKNEKGRMGLLVLLYSTLGCINLYPLCNSYHILTCLFPFLVLVLPYLAWLQRFRLVQIAAAGAVFACLVDICGVKPYAVVKNSVLLTDVPHFQGIFMDRGEEEEYRDIVEEVKLRKENGFDVYILDNEAVKYLIPSDIYHKYTDMFLVGNLGQKTPGDCLDDTLYTSGQAMYLIPSDLDDQYQYPRQAVESFIEEKLDYAQTIGHFRCYMPRV